MNIFVTVLTLAAVFSSSEAGPQGRITHGHLAAEREFPFYVGVTDGNVVCGGAIISNYWVISAAHCFNEITVIILQIGSTDAFSPELRLRIPRNKVTIHPDYTRGYWDNDIALIRTPYIGYTSKIKNVLLPTMRDESELGGYLVTSMGWGADHNDVLDRHNLKYTIMRAMTSEECEPNLIDNGITGETTLCAMTYMGSFCDGDSGGPVIVGTDNILVGIVNFASHPSCPRGEPIGMARVTHYRDWIKNVSGVYRP